jgi:hypothetical protein
MSKKNQNPPVESAPVEVEDLPIVTALGVVRTKAGWASVYLETQGDRVVAREVLAGPDSRAVVLEKAKIEFVTRILLPKAKVSA